MKDGIKGVSELRITERLSLRVFFVFVLFCFCFFFAVIHPTWWHILRKESTIKYFVDALELFDDQRPKRARII